MFVDVLNAYLKRYNADPIEGVFYNGYTIKTNADSVCIIDGFNHIKHTVESVRQARELIDSICSGC
jgi:hypothetical protein